VASRLGFAVTERRHDAAQLAEECARFAPTVILLDPQSLGVTEIDLMSRLAHHHGNATIIIASDADALRLASAEEFGLAYGLHVSLALKKPLTEETLEAALAPQVVSRYPFTEQDLRRAIDRAQLVVHYQPKVCATPRGWKVTGIEALAALGSPGLRSRAPERLHRARRTVRSHRRADRLRAAAGIDQLERVEQGSGRDSISRST
jgi:DNA-binding NarL/FixJ family response regulator